jgi:hypothetical protein
MMHPIHREALFHHDLLAAGPTFAEWLEKN